MISGTKISLNSLKYGRKERKRTCMIAEIHDLDQTLLIVLQEKHFLKSVRESVQDFLVHVRCCVVV